MPQAYPPAKRSQDRGKSCETKDQVTSVAHTKQSERKQPNESPTDVSHLTEIRPEHATFKPDELNIAHYNGDNRSSLDMSHTSKVSYDPHARNHALQRRIGAMERMLRDRMRDSEVLDYSAHYPKTIAAQIASESETVSNMNQTASHVTSYL